MEDLKPSSKNNSKATVNNNETEINTGDPKSGIVFDKDAAILESIGYRQEFKREFSIFSTFGVAFSILGILPSIAATLGYSMGYAGYVGMTWGWIVAATFIQFVGLSMAELCSSLPTAGGLYYASAALAPEGYGPLAAWITGWSNFIGQSTFAPSVDWSLSSMILACASIGNPSYTPTNWQTFLLYLLLLFSHTVVSVMSTKYVAKFNIISTYLNLLILVVFFVVTPAASINSPKTNSPNQVWTELDNGTDWPNGIAFLMSFLTVIWTMCGFDAPFHLSEECSNANTACPLAICLTVHVGGLLGFFTMLVIAYTTKDISSVINSPIGQPMASFLQQVLGNEGALGVMSLIIVTLWLVGQGAMVTASRVVYAYSRDGALPGSKYLYMVNQTTYTPVRAVWLLFIIGIGYGLLGFNSIAINAIFSVGAIAQYIAFSIPVLAKIWAGKKFRPGPFNLGKFSLPVNILACSFVLLMVPILCLPSTSGKDLNNKTMNYTCLVYGGPILLSLVWYAVDARKWFKGPKVNIDHVIYFNVAEISDEVK